MPCSVSKAYDGKESVNLIENSHFDVIFMDVGMPEMSGIEATQKIRSMGIETPIIAVTIGAFETDREECLSAGMNDWLPKLVNLGKKQKGNSPFGRSPHGLASVARAASEGWCSGRDLNPHTLRHTPLKRACLPIPPPEH
jgi:CheY-like chemotaxis protein